MSFSEARDIVPTLTQGEFRALDANGDNFLTREELQGRETGCFKKSESPYTSKAKLGDLLLVGIVLLTLVRWYQWVG